jgi:hypothetical protein
MLSLSGVHVTATNDMHLLWAFTNGTTTNIYRQSYRNGTKQGGIVPVVTNIAGASPRLVLGRTDKTSAILWRMGSSAAPFRNVGRLILPNGALGGNIGFNLAPGESLRRVDGIGTSFVATTAVSNSNFTATATYGRSFNSAFALQPAQPLLQPAASFAKNPFTQIATRGDGKVVFFNGLTDSGGQVDMSARTWSSSWTLPGALVQTAPNLPSETEAGPVSARLPNGGLLTAQTLEDGAGYSIVFRTLGANLAQIGVSAKIGPLPDIAISSVTPLANGKVIASYRVGERLYIRQVTP